VQPPLYPGGGPVYPPVWVMPPIHLPPGSSLPPESVWPPQHPPVVGGGPATPPGRPPQVGGGPATPPGVVAPPIVVPPDKIAVLIVVLGYGYRWSLIDKPDDGDKPEVSPKPPEAQPKGR
jgi:hypothetical protein